MSPRSDIQIRVDVMRTLRYDPRIDVTVKSGVVQLRGTVDSYAVRLLAQEAAQCVEGVFTVNNEISVSGPSMAWTDGELELAIRKALEWDALIPNERIKVTVSNRWVALEGQVELLREREEAEHVVQRMAGVRGVYNAITVSISQTVPENVHDAIEEELKLRAKLEADRISVSMKDGTVMLTGDVQSWEEQRAIIKAASEAPGVQKLEAHLHIGF